MLVANYVALAGLLVSQAAGHGLITRIQGANGVGMPGLTVTDGIPRDCPSAACGAQKDTSIARDQEFGTIKASALGRTMGGGPVDPSAVIMRFMGDTKGKRATGVERRQMINDAASVITNAGGTILNGAQDLADATPFGSAVKAGQSAVDDVLSVLPGLKSGAVTKSGSKENGIAMYSGKGASTGLPTASKDGVVTMVYHQVNQDGAGPLTADIDPSSGGTDPKAFKRANVIQNVAGVAGFSTSSAMDYEIKVQVPKGMKCTATVGSAKNVCIVRVRNTAISGPFGGAAAFTQ